MKYLGYILLLKNLFDSWNPKIFTLYFIHYVIVAFHLEGAANHRYITLLPGSKAQWTHIAQDMLLREKPGVVHSIRCIMSIAAKMTCAAYAGSGQSNNIIPVENILIGSLSPCIWQLRYHLATVWLHVQWHSRTKAISSPTAPNIKFREVDPWYQR